MLASFMNCSISSRFKVLDPGEAKLSSPGLERASATKSDAPPGANGTIMRIGLLGYAPCANALVAAASARTNNVVNLNRIITPPDASAEHHHDIALRVSSGNGIARLSRAEKSNALVSIN